MARLIPLLLTFSCFSKIQIGFTFLVPAHLGSPGKRAVKRVCVCVCTMSVHDVVFSLCSSSDGTKCHNIFLSVLLCFYLWLPRYNLLILCHCCRDCITGLIVADWLMLLIVCCGPSPAGCVRLRTLPAVGAQKFTTAKLNVLATSRRAVTADEPELLLTSM